LVELNYISNIILNANNDYCVVLLKDLVDFYMC